ncbi:inositol-tetrakisphosphate 1-kinase 1-like [Bidens hawaiensis]|uniref:inositol-tetrakisphosphate 1-kinase 1-like n=1 Tax=Bidens hawaiensis TaxID=980011 RepID=UPI00404A9EB5
MVESFITYVEQRGIDFIPIDVLTKPLTEQGPFDCIIHKSYGQEWDKNLETFSINHPYSTVIDRPSAIQRLHNRISMLEPVSQLNIPKLSIPNQLLVQDFEALKSIQMDKDLVFPVIAKPLLADGDSGTHNMLLVVNHEGLTKGLKFDSPMVLQEFVNHGGVIFKVYVANDYVKCVKRGSLPDVSNETREKIKSESGGVMGFSQISSSVITGDDTGSSSNNKSDEKLKMPTQEFLVEMADGLRQALGLHLFNFDMIKDDKTDDYLVVDINYFPGFEKLPYYESVMTDFLLNIKKSQEEKKMMKKEVGVHDEAQA